MDFRFLHTSDFRKWVILAPRRSLRPDVAKGTEHICPFCPGREANDEELYRVSKEATLDVRNWKLDKDPTSSSDWLIRVIPNKFPFTSVHELIIHSPDHHKNIDELPREHVHQLLTVYRQRYQLHQDKGQVCLFHNRGIQAGESIPHAHTQVTVVPSGVQIDAPLLLEAAGKEGVHTKYFHIFSPKVSQWPDEVWIVPKRSEKRFGDIDDEEITDLAFCLPRLVQLMDLRHGYEFPFNYFIHPGVNWYIRFIPRQKTIGGFEVGTGIYVNTQDPEETNSFLRQYFQATEVEIAPEHKASYAKHV